MALAHESGAGTHTLTIRQGGAALVTVDEFLGGSSTQYIRGQEAP
jgi:hypothetical protein